MPAGTPSFLLPYDLTSRVVARSCGGRTAKLTPVFVFGVVYSVVNAFAQALGTRGGRGREDSCARAAGRRFSSSNSLFFDLASMTCVYQRICLDIDYEYGCGFMLCGIVPCVWTVGVVMVVRERHGCVHR